MERFVYVQQGEGFEKRNVKVGVSDFFYAEIQEGLSAGEIVSLQMPKEDLEKKTHQLAGQRPGSGNEGVALKPTVAPRSTNSVPASTGSSSEPGKAKPRADISPRRETAAAP